MKRKKPTKSSPSFARPEIQQIEQLLQFMTEHSLEEFEYSRGDLRIRLRKTSAGVVVAAPRVMAAPEIIVPGSMEAPHASAGGVPAKIYTWSSPPSWGRFMSRPVPGRRLL